MAEPTRATKVVLLGGVPEIPGALPLAAAADCPQPVHPIARDVRFTEEPDVGNLQVRFREGC